MARTSKLVAGMPTLKKRRAAPEDALHGMIWKALRLCLGPTVVCWSNENRHNGLKEGIRRKARGVIAGVPDMVFHWSGGIAYVEIKVPGGVPSEAQMVLHRRLRAIGVPVAVCFSLVEVLQFLKAQGCPLRAQVP